MLGCVSVTVDAPSICDTEAMKKLSMTSIPPQIATLIPPTAVTYVQDINISEALSKVNQYTDTITVDVKEFSIADSANDLSWVDNVQVSIIEGDKRVIVLDYALRPEDKVGSSVNLAPLKIETSKLYNFLSTGNVAFIFTLTATAPPRTPQLSGTVCISASASASKKLSEISKN